MPDFRPLTEADLSMLCDWLNRPHLQRWWRKGTVSLDTVRRKYLPRIAGAADARPFLALLQREPFGFIQVYRCDAGTVDWWPDDPGFGVLGIDQFIADGRRLGRGLGTRMVRAFTDRLLCDGAFVAEAFGEPRFLDEPVVEVRTDPRPDNARAIRCYEKAGFRRVQPFENPDGPAVMMVRRAD
jgi:aminoglycoside 6'-N-acetyltransferase-1b/aminoglycoside 6'-N-acetyltransferase-2